MFLYFVVVPIVAFFLGCMLRKAMVMLSIHAAKFLSERIWRVLAVDSYVGGVFICLTLRSVDQEQKRLPVILRDTPENRIVLFSLNPPYELIKFVFTYQMLWYLPAYRTSSYLLIKKATASDSAARAHA